MLRACHVLLLLIALSAGCVMGGDHVYCEDFTSFEFCDVIKTEAWWDTLNGELKLPPYQPVWLWHYFTPSDSCYGVTISGNYAYVGDYACGLQIFDISDPEHPFYLASYDTPDYAHNIAVSGDYAYVADWNGGLQVVDISDPANPCGAGSCVTSCVYSVDISGDHAFLCGPAILKVADISDPTNPVIVAARSFPSGGRYAEVSGDHIYIADGVLGLMVMDITDPLEPALVGSCAAPGFARGLSVSGDLVCIGSGVAGLSVFDVSDPTNPVLTAVYDTPGNARRVRMTGSCVYVADHSTGLVALDISDPWNPELIGTCRTPCHAHGVALDGDYACVVDWCYGFHVARIADFIECPLRSGDCMSATDARGVATVGSYACVADGASGFKTIDISQPTIPTAIGNCETPGEAYRVALSGDCAFVGDGTCGLQVIDISDLSSPQPVAGLDTPGEARGVAVAGDYVYVADGLCGLRVINVADPLNPSPAGSCGTPGFASDIAIAGDCAYVCDGGYGLQVIDITDPTSPVLHGSCDTPGDAQGLFLSGDYAYVGDGSSGLQVIDIADPAYPSLAGSFDTPGNARDVAVAGNYVCVGDETSGLQILDVSNPLNPTLAAAYDTPGDAQGIVISCDHVCVADGPSGFRMVKIFERHLDRKRCTARSLPIDGADDVIVGARLSASRTDSVRWKVSSNAGFTWRDIAPADTFSVLSSSGCDLIWKSTHLCAVSGVNPCCSDLCIEWVFEFAAIDSIADVPEDQGHQVRLAWTKSGYDDAECSPQVTEYTLFRRADPPSGTIVDKATVIWDSVGTVTPDCGPCYSATVATSIDSTISGGMHYSAFFVRAWVSRPDIFFDSPVDSGYSVDNLAPSVPTGLAMHSPSYLAWDDAAEADFDHFTVYGSSVSELDSTATVLGTTAANGMDISGQEYGYYHVTATDVSGNEGNASSIENAYATLDTGGLPEVYSLIPNRPDPFGTTTVIGFALPAPGVIDLSVFDVNGKTVAALRAGSCTAGRHKVTWTGLDARGRRVPPGIYFVVLKAGEFRASDKMILLK